MTKKELLDDIAIAEQMLGKFLVQVRDMEKDCARYEHALKDFLKRSLEENMALASILRYFVLILRDTAYNILTGAKTI